MALTQPTLNAVPFANSGSKNTIPKTSTVTGKASMTQGFPDVTMLPIASGGLPPSGKDFNGILNQLSQHQVWQNAGGMYKFDATFCTAIGGYPKGAVVLSNDGLSAYICTTTNNSNDPNSNMTGWALFGGKVISDNIDDKADQITTISAGNGLTGGGSLAANRTLSLGTPGQITASSTNATTTTSHTHAIDSASTSREGIVQLNDSLTNTSTALALTAKQGKVLNDSKADQSTLINAGNGLTGGGSLSIDRTLALGTPGQITASSTNATSTTSHTHAIDSASTSREGIVQLNDSLTSTSTVQALTAKQGKVLKDLIDGIDVTVGAIGVNQSWQDVTSSRAKETTYTNNTGSPIQVLISLLSHDDNTFTAVYVGSIKIMHLYFDISDGGGHGTTPAAFIVPSGDTYRVTGNANVEHWAELR